MPTSKFIKTLLILSGISLFLLNSCIDRIYPNTSRGGNQLVIEGKITNGNGPFTVSIGRTSNNERVMEPVDGAHVVIYDDSAKDHETYYEDSKGTYTVDGSIVKGHPGHAYHIEVELQNGSTYRSSPEIMPSAVTKDSAYYKFGIEKIQNGYELPSTQKVVRVYVNTHISSTTKPVYLRWYLSEVYIFGQYHPNGPIPPPFVYCYVTAYPNPQQIFLYNSEINKETTINNQLMATRLIDYSFYFRHFFNVHVASLTRQAYLYWKHVDEIVNSNGTIFDVPPASVSGNIYNPSNKEETVLGYFEAVSEDTTRCEIYRSDLPTYVDNPCRTPDAQTGCASCLILNNSTLTEPYYFKK